MGAMTCRAAALTGLLTLAAGSLPAQSLTSVRGLGHPLLPVDARTEALGGIGVGLQGLTGSLLDPTAAAGVARRGATVSAASVDQTGTMGDLTGDYGATRFPLIQLTYPVRGVVLTAGYGGYLDQSWAVRRDGEQVVSGSTVTYRDFIRSSGGIGQVQVGAAVPLGRGFAVGVAVGALTGSRTMQFQRLFDATDVGDLNAFVERRSVVYGAPMARIGARWDPIAAVRVAASATWAGTLDADSLSGRAVSTSYDMPLQLAGGVSAYLAPSLLATVSGRWSGWSAMGEVVGGGFGSADPATGVDAWEVGGGLEWDDPASRRPRNYPVRFGGSYRQLPFTFGGEAPTEWFVGAGTGMRLGSLSNPAARVDLTVQRGERTAPGDATTGGALTETAWRVSLGLSLFGN